MSALQEAERVVTTDRQKDYGHPYDDFSRAMGMLNALGYRFQLPDGTYRELTASDQSIILVCVKLSREVNHHKMDNIVDIHGYMKCLEMVLERQREILAKTMRAEAEASAAKSAVLALEEPGTVSGTIKAFKQLITPLPDSSNSVYPAHPDDAVALTMSNNGLFRFGEWNEFKVKFNKSADQSHAALIAFASQKGLGINDVWTALNQTPT